MLLTPTPRAAPSSLSPSTVEEPFARSSGRGLGATRRHHVRSAGITFRCTDPGRVARRRQLVAATPERTCFSACGADRASRSVGVSPPRVHPEVIGGVAGRRDCDPGRNDARYSLSPRGGRGRPGPRRASRSSRTPERLSRGRRAARWDERCTALTECFGTLVGCRLPHRAPVCAGTGAQCQGRSAAPDSKLVYFAHAGFVPTNIAVILLAYRSPTRCYPARGAVTAIALRGRARERLGTPTFGTATIVGWLRLDRHAKPASIAWVCHDRACPADLEPTRSVYSAGPRTRARRLGGPRSRSR